ncbi:MAG: hypothetical protein L6Q95_02885 [Planctomycetes bacterium]|nr:hypothetical protein [Planctomycetota bacterium]
MPRLRFDIQPAHRVGDRVAPLPGSEFASFGDSTFFADPALRRLGLELLPSLASQIYLEGAELDVLAAELATVRGAAEDLARAAEPADDGPRFISRLLGRPEPSAAETAERLERRASSWRSLAEVGLASIEWARAQGGGVLIDCD